jgi:hypothetical protein
MKFRVEELSVRHRVDMIGSDSQVVATIEIGSNRGKARADWWVSGVTESDELRLLLHLETAHHFDPTTGLDRNAGFLEEFYATLIRPIVAESIRAGGVIEQHARPIPQITRPICIDHLMEHNAIGNLGDQLTIRKDIARQYQLVKSFGHYAPIPLLAEWSGLPRSTVARRLHLARESGEIEKTSEYLKPVRAVNPDDA